MIRFLTIARVLYDKGFKELIDCASYYKKIGAAVEFEWLGSIDIGYPQFVREEDIFTFQSKGIFNYLGFHSDVRKYISEADCIILPSYHEGMSRVLMESLAMRKPIITTDIPGCKETVLDGINGFLCLPRDSRSLIESVGKFLALTPQERKQMGIRSREYAELKFDIKKVIDKYDEVIESILSK